MSMVKPWVSLDEQIDILVQRGLTDAPDFRDLIEHTGYYRLSGFAYPFRYRTSGTADSIERSERFLPGSSMHNVVQLYQFDENLRSAVWLAVRELELAVRIRVGHELGRVDPLLHERLEQLWPSGKMARRAAEFTKKLNDALKRSKEEFVIHHRRNYDDHMPVWVLTEALDFGGLVTLFSLAPFDQRCVIADRFGCRADEFESWLRTMNLLRNISAHHARLWNKVVTVRPITKYKENSAQFSACLRNPGKPFAALTILAYLLARMGASSKQRTLQVVLSEFPTHIPGITPAMMGMPRNWDNAPVWQC
ncbi:Abi family protein [Corynebacterium sp. 153RC1]|uniref:Abi family protein n=1 Tax=unclassified Corynebacterium TaxID=2624378 RepID=UPI00211C41A9|nr:MULTISPECIES: Abi family protein [unclassified Corynebacterium]MCQ9370823.1 Abi family protein [Corynebacterium sp. 35RC1]MCQ9353506.1 Abi family protein [Corynebacterium sp. 209RC1]MCQ9355126.1 Abi family protein [Corynebacterium sp. 1222RC1]MCQ9357251.1 Abi family protein [Corynebacterium sp. 122RC1]MCQ9359426.1 Abi family protein [Corynebacterium sp. 142RC1]